MVWGAGVKLPQSVFTVSVLLLLFPFLCYFWVLRLGGRSRTQPPVSVLRVDTALSSSKSRGLQCPGQCYAKKGKGHCVLSDLADWKVFGRRRRDEELLLGRKCRKQDS